MAKVIFVQNIWAEVFGPMHISAVLKKNGHYSEIVLEMSLKHLADRVKEISPDIVCFYCATGLHLWALSRAGFIKSLNKTVKIVFGGPHPTLMPQIIKHPAVDIICRGEGEEAMLHLADALSADRLNFKQDIEGLWFKNNGSIKGNETARLIEDLDALPFADRSYYQNYRHFKITQVRSFIAGRGCPFTCNYCINDSLLKIYKGKGRYVRLRSPESIIDEILFVKNKYGLRFVNFYDDTISLDRNWLMLFLEKYSRIKIPFHCNVRADLLTEEITKSLGAAGCQTVAFGIESGNENLRNIVLNKKISNEEIVRAAILLKKSGIRFKTYNMLGLPGETLANAFETVEINSRIKADYPWCSVFIPYPGTRIAEYAKEKGFLKHNFDVDDVPALYLTDTVLEQPEQKRIINLQRFFHLAVKAPYLRTLIRQLIKLPPNIVFDLVYFSYYAYYQLKKIYQMKFGEFVSTLLVSRNIIKRVK